MAEALSGGWPEQLERLLELLRQDGFRVGLTETLRLQQLLLALVDRNVPLDDPERLARLLGPVLCRSASEQEAFGRHLQEWWPGPVLLEAGAASPEASPLEQALAAVEQRRGRLLRWLPTLALAAGSAALLVAGQLGLQQLQRRPAAPAPGPPGAVTNPPAPVARPPNPPTAQSRAPAEPRTQPLSPPIPSPSAPAALVPGREQAFFLLPSELALLTLLGGLLALLLALLVVQGVVRLWWWRQARLVLERLQLRGESQLQPLNLGEIERDLVPGAELHRIGRALNLWQRRLSAQLDGAATVAASLRHGGWLSLRYRARRQRLSYLFFLDQASLADQQTRYWQAWLERLRLEGVLADWVCFQQQPLYGLGPNGHGPLRSLRELAATHPDAVAVLVADAERFFSPVDGTPLPWIQALAAWPQRFVLTPRPRARWGALEAELAEQLPVLPVSVQGLLELARQLLGAPPRPPSEEEANPAPAAEPSLLAGSVAPWLDRTPAAAEHVQELLEQLRAHLGPEGFTWLAACAVFPELHWAITAYLGQRLRNDAGEPLLRRCPLPRLARLPWLRHGFMPDWLRLPLILRLDAAQETAVRQALIELLKNALDQQQAGNAKLQVATGLSQRLPRLLPPLLELLRRRSSATSPLRDQLFLRFLQQRPLLAADAPESLRRLLPPQPLGARLRGAWAELGPRGLALAALLLLGLGALTLAVVRQGQIAWIEQLLRNSPAATSGAPASLRLQRAITALGLSRSSLMRLGPDPDLRRVEMALAEALATFQGDSSHSYPVSFSPGFIRSRVQIHLVIEGTQPWQHTLPIACRRLAIHPSLNDWPWLNSARATCRHFTGLPRSEANDGLLASLRPWLLPAAGLGAAGLALGLGVQWRRRGRLTLAAQPASSPWPRLSLPQLPTAQLLTALQASLAAWSPAAPLASLRRWLTDSHGAPALLATAISVPPASEPEPPAPCADLSLRPLTVTSAQLRRKGRAWRVETREGIVPSAEEPLGNGVSLRLIEIPAGSFLMGSPRGEPERSPAEGPLHLVRLEGFLMGQTPITQAQWREVAGWKPKPGERWRRELSLNPSRFQNVAAGEKAGQQDEQSSNDQRPVERVSWHDAIEFCHRLSQRTGRHYSLPSEAQWEYACRAGSTTPFAFGETLTPELANYNGNYSYANGPEGKDRSQTTPVASFPANRWGLHDMPGNVWEWCLDHWHSSYTGAPVDGSAWLDQSSLNEKTANKTRLLRGGSWVFHPRNCRSAYRYLIQPAMPTTASASVWSASPRALPLTLKPLIPQHWLFLNPGLLAVCGRAP